MRHDIARAVLEAAPTSEMRLGELARMEEPRPPPMLLLPRAAPRPGRAL